MRTDRFEVIDVIGARVHRGYDSTAGREDKAATLAFLVLLWLLLLVVGGLLVL